MRSIYLWIEKYIQIENYNCNLAGNIEFTYDVDRKILEGKNKGYYSGNFFNRKKFIEIYVMLLSNAYILSIGRI